MHFTLHQCYNDWCTQSFKTEQVMSNEWLDGMLGHDKPWYVLSTMFFDGISEQHAAGSGGMQCFEDRGSEHTGSAHAQGHCSPAWPLWLLLLKTGVCQNQPNLTLAYITALQSKQRGRQRQQRAQTENYLETQNDLERDNLEETFNKKSLQGTS